MDTDPDPYWYPASTSGSGSVKNEYGSETLNFISNYSSGSGSTSQKVTVPTFLRFRFWFHNAGRNMGYVRARVEYCEGKGVRE